MITIKEVAQKAGVSIGTVSNVFKHPERVAHETKEQILAIAEELGFSPNPLASALVTSKTHIIGLIVSYVYSSSRGIAVNEFTKAASEHGYLVFLQVAEMDIDKEKEAVDYFIKYRVDGVVVFADYAEGQSEHFVKLTKYNIPCIVFKRYNKAYGNITVSADKAFQDLAMQLKRYGHENIGVVVPYLYYKDGTPNIRAKRIETFQKYLAAVDLSLPEDNLLYIETDTIAAGEKAVDDWLASKRILPTVFLCFYEIATIGMINRMKERGYRIPEDISFVAYSNSKIGQFSMPKLATISIHEADMILKALEMLLKRIEHPAEPLCDFECTHVFEYHESLKPASTTLHK